MSSGFLDPIFIGIGIGIGIGVGIGVDVGIGICAEAKVQAVKISKCTKQNHSDSDVNSFTEN